MLDHQLFVATKTDLEKVKEGKGKHTHTSTNNTLSFKLTFSLERNCKFA